MLVLSRKMNERVYFPGFDTYVQVVDTRPGVVRLGITAPRSVVCLREEIAAEPEETNTFLNSAEHVHTLNGKLHIVSIGLVLLKKQLDADQPNTDVIGTIDRITRSIEVTEPTTSLESSHRRRRSVLVVEDDANERELVSGLLRLYNYDVEATDSGSEAIRILTGWSKKPHIVLLDMSLGKGMIDGCEVARNIRSNPDLHKTKIVMMTGRNAPAKVPNVDRWLTKPVVPERLLHEIDNLCSENV
jgi:carbon storage regulator CsrA